MFVGSSGSSYSSKKFDSLLLLAFSSELPKVKNLDQFLWSYEHLLTKFC